VDFYNLLGDRFIAAGDYNAKHTHWGSRLVTPKGRQIYNAIIKPNNKLDYVSPGNPTYWPTDPRKVPDLIEFAVTKNIPRNIPPSTKHPLWRAHPNLSSPIETVTPIRNSSGGWVFRANYIYCFKKVCNYV